MAVASVRRTAVIGLAALATSVSGMVIGLIAPAAAVACPTPNTLADGSLLVTITSSCDWTVPNGVSMINLIVVGGGGGAAPMRVAAAAVCSPSRTGLWRPAPPGPPSSVSLTRN